MHNKEIKKIFTGIWIDHRQAFIVKIKNSDKIKFITLESDAGSHSGLSGGFRAKTAYSHSGIKSESRYENKYYNHLNSYYEDIIKHIDSLNTLIIFGPGEAKKELLSKIEKSFLDNVKIAGVMVKGRMTKNQIIAYVKKFFNLK